MESRGWSGSWCSELAWPSQLPSAWRLLSPLQSGCGGGCGWSWTCSWCRRRGASCEREWVRVQVKRVQRAIRVRAIAVRVVRPHRVELARVRGQTNVVTIVDAVGRRRRVREPAAQARVRRPGHATIGAEGAEVFRIVVRNRCSSRPDRARRCHCGNRESPLPPCRLCDRA